MSGANRVWIEGSPQLSVSTPAQTSQGVTAGVILTANPKRKGIIIQNTGTTVIKLSFGSTLPTATAYHVALAVCTSANDGTGGIYMDDSWVGQVNALSSGAGGTMVITELQTGSPDWDRSSDWGL